MEALLHRRRPIEALPIGASVPAFNLPGVPRVLLVSRTTLRLPLRTSKLLSESTLPDGRTLAAPFFFFFFFLVLLLQLLYL
jgi:hypothetical protein